GQCWWFGVNNGKHGHIRLMDIRPFMLGQEPEFAWPIGNSKPKGLYTHMKEGDRVLFWTGHGDEPEWGFIGTATISALHHDRIIFGRARRFSTALTPYPKKYPHETDVIRSLERIFGRDYPPLGDVMRAVFGTRRRHPITVHPIGENAFEEVMKLAQAPPNAR
ncbi:MAG TPA: hypothetical protein PKW66_22940, partial [Polyangiaceae bacterium]|nr:hypothetical protein [Polyangiaceae bacterium]